MKIRFELIEQKATWESFLSKQANPTFLQAWDWGDFQKKLGRTVFRIGIFDDNDLIGICLCYILKTRLRTHLYTSGGPIIDWSQANQIMPELINYLTTIAKANHAKFVRIDPQIIDSQENNELLKNFGLIKASTNSQAEKKWILDLTPDLETLLNNMRKNTRYAIRKAEKQQIVTTFTTKVDEFTTFWELFVKTFNNKKFIPHPKSYYQKQIESFEESQSYRQYFSKAEDKLLCSALFMFYGQSVSYLHAATDNENRELFGAYDMIWTVIKDAKSKGYKYLDFWGIAPNDDPKHPWHGFTFFKKGFGGFELNIIRAYDKPVSWDYVLIRLIENLLQIWKRIYSKS